MNIFISHSWTYHEHYNRLAEWIFSEMWFVNKHPIYFSDTSVPRDNPIHFAETDDQLQAAIFARIVLSQVVVIPTGMYAHHSKWIQKEIDGSRFYGKPILAVDPWGQQRTASVVASAATETVSWNKQSVINAIWRLGNKGPQ